MKKKIILTFIITILSVWVIGCTNNGNKDDLSASGDLSLLNSETYVSSIETQEADDIKTDVPSSKTGSNSTETQNSSERVSEQNDTVHSSEDNSRTEVIREPYGYSVDESGIDLPIDLF